MFVILLDFMLIESTIVSFIGICYGFELMMSHKSPSVPFTLMLTRFKEGWIVENFSMLGYIIPTAPGNKIRFHWNNHMGKKAQLRLWFNYFSLSACSVGYNMDY